ncbi:radical SAM protein [Pyrococcus yayanosii]|uniref:Biotin synthase-related protein n=1 Tax=Pyrococcus yayanosii (strain CH1 / JCM 16557) TaxID=529709 RepID=F8AEE6_PYRYC|nr:radical SAM protein [Pyrococcus yayanosii]AEH25347.1 biotin synthase-related protein [Pyrococcus yayanosii CH1]
MLIRISYGTAIAMGLIRARMLARPTTAYLMTYFPGHCRNDCAFCPQARSSRANLEKLSRVVWPVFELEEVLEVLPKGGFSRICLQTVDYPGLVDDVLELLEALHPLGLPVSISITPVSKDVLEAFRELGVDHVGIGLDVASESLYGKIKRSLYSWRDMWKFTEDVIEVLGKGKAIVHLIAGLGETDRELLATIQGAYDMGAEVSLFAFTPVKGTALENGKSPPLRRYRRVQVALHIIRLGIARAEEFHYDEEGNLVSFGISKDELRGVLGPWVFVTHGCPGCNRPHYNERPGREPYNYPDVYWVRIDFERIIKELGIL